MKIKIVSRLAERIFSRIQRFLFISANATNKIRREFVAGFLQGLPQNTSLLDVGAGTQKYRQFCSHLKYSSQDFAQYDGKGDGVGFQSGSWDIPHTDIISDITSIPIDDSAFDAAICTDVLEHVPDVYSALLELNRVVKPGGQILITVPSQCDAHQTPYFFSGGYSAYLFKKVFSEHKVTVEYESGYFETVDQKLGLGFGVLVNLTRRKPVYLLVLAGYIILSMPLSILLRMLPKFVPEIGNNGLLVIIEKSNNTGNK
jgi:SAM-dependent methyltransferase